MLVDGVSLYAPEFGGVRWSRLPVQIEDLERVEVIRGPRAALYGANATRGVVNLVTRSPGDRHRTTLRTVGGYPAYGRAHASVDGSLDTTRIRLSGSFEVDDGFERGSNDDQVGGQLGTRIEHAWSSRWDLTIGAQTRFDDFLLPARLADLPPSDRDGTYSYAYGRLGYREGEDEGSIQVSASLRTETEPPESGIVGPDQHAHRREVELRWRRTASPDLSLVTTAEYGYQRARSLVFGLVGFDLSRGFDPTADTNFRSSSRPFKDQHLVGAGIQLDWAPDDLALNVGSRLEWDSLSETLSPSGGVAGIWTVSPQHRIRLAVARASRIPNLVEAHLLLINFPDSGALARIVGNEDLRPEVVTSFEAGWRGATEDGRLGVNVELFAQRTEDGILPRAEVRPTGTTIEPFGPLVESSIGNAEDFWAAGVEIELRARPVPEVQLRATYTLTEEIGRDFADFAPPGLDLDPLTPPPSGLRHRRGRPSGRAGRSDRGPRPLALRGRRRHRVLRPGDPGGLPARSPSGSLLPRRCAGRRPDRPERARPGGRGVRNRRRGRGRRTGPRAGDPGGDPRGDHARPRPSPGERSMRSDRRSGSSRWLVALLGAAIGVAGCGRDPSATDEEIRSFLPSTSATLAGTITLLDASDGAPDFPAWTPETQLLVALFEDRSFPPTGAPNVIGNVPLDALDPTALAAGVPQPLPYRIDETTGLVNGAFSVTVLLDVDGNGLFDPDRGDCSLIAGVLGPPTDPLPVAVTLEDGVDVTLDALFLAFYCDLPF